MIISTKGRYALRLMIDLGLQNENEYVSLKDIAKRQDISIKYLEQIIALLNKQGLLKTLRGAKGGYKLSKSTSEYNIEEILAATEGTLAPVSCLESDVNTCERQDICATLRLWTELDEAVKSVLRNRTLADLVKWQKEIYEKQSGNYVI